MANVSETMKDKPATGDGNVPLSDWGDIDTRESPTQETDEGWNKITKASQRRWAKDNPWLINQ